MEIRSELQDVSAVKKRLKVEVPADIALKELNQVADEYRRHARLPGFRPGKAPVALIKRHFQKSIRGDVIQKLIPSSYDQAIREKGVQPLGEPSLENLTFEEGQPLVYEANFEIRPQIELPEYEGIEIHAELKSVTEEDTDRELEKVREQHSRLVSVDGRPVQEGDYVIVDLHGEYLDAVEGGQDQQTIDDDNVVVQVGHDHTHEAFTRALLGMEVAQTKEFEVDYAPDYPEEKLAGYQVRFTVEINDIKSKELPDLNDDFAKDLGEFETLDQLRDKIQERLGDEREKNRESELRNQLISRLIEGTTFEVPDTLVEDRVDGMLRDVAYRMASQGIDPGKANVDWVKVRADLRPEAEKQVRSNLILGEIAAREQVEVSSEELDSEVKKVASSMGQPEEKVRQYFQQGEQEEGLRRQVAREKVLERLMQSAKMVGD